MRSPTRPFAVHAVLGLDVADDRLDSRATLHLATDGGRDAANLTYSYAKGRLVLSVGLSTHKHVFKSELKSD